MRHQASPSPTFRAPTRFWVLAAFALAFALLAASTGLAYRQQQLALALGPAAVMALLCAGLISLLRQFDRMRRVAEALVVAEGDARRALALVDATHDGVFIYDAASLRFSYVNQGAIDQVGYSREELLALTALELKREFDEPRFRALLAPLLAGGVTTVALETHHRRKDGEEIPVEVSLQCVPQDGGAPSIVTVARDISARRRAEEERDRLNRELTERQAALEAANKELEAFSYSVSHDLRAPLRHIDGYSRMLLEDAEGLSADARRQLTAIGDSSRRMGALIDDLLAFSRLSRKPIVARGIDMAALARHALEELPATPEATVAIGALPQAFGDPVLLEQVWVNLLSNALKYSAPRGAQRRVEVAGERDGTVNRYRVCDNGVGFDMRYADKLFGVFQRLHSQDEFEGTGVGLAIVQRILARHGGSIRAEAEPQRGATFIFELPAQEMEA